MSKSYSADRHANARDRKLAKRRGDKMVVTNRSIFTIQEVIGKKAKDAKDAKSKGRP
jgi:hypothetical protein